MKGGRGSGVGKRHSLNGDSRAAPAGMFPILPLGHSGPWSSRGGCLICQTKVVNVCLASSLALGGSDHPHLDVRDCSALGGRQSRTFWGGMEGWAALCGLQVPRSAHLGSKHYPERQKPQTSAPPCLRAPGTTGRVAKARPGSWLWQCQAGDRARPRCRGKS